MIRTDDDRERGLLTITIDGFLAPDEVPALAMTLGGLARDAHAAGRPFDVLVDSRGFPVQANDVADGLALIMRGGMALTPGHAAVVVGSHLNKLQAERTLVHPRLRVFLALDEAQDWLATMRPVAGGALNDGPAGFRTRDRSPSPLP